MAVVTKQILDKVYKENFDKDRFLSVDPCGVVYKLMEHTDNQLDIELGALFVAMITWGSRKVICPTALRMLRDEMRWRPAHFIMSRQYLSSYTDAKNGCVYRTLNVDAFKDVCENIYHAIQGYGTLEALFDKKSSEQVIQAICEWLRPAKVGSLNKSACKRVCMYLRWMTRDKSPDIGLWKSRSKKDLYAIMDVHVIRQTKGLISNSRPTWKACVELTTLFKEWDAEDPLKYDVALMTLADMDND